MHEIIVEDVFTELPENRSPVSKFTIPEDNVSNSVNRRTYISKVNKTEVSDLVSNRIRAIKHSEKLLTIASVKVVEDIWNVLNS